MYIHRHTDAYIYTNKYARYRRYRRVTSVTAESGALPQSRAAAGCYGLLRTTSGRFPHLSARFAEAVSASLAAAGCYGPLFAVPPPICEACRRSFGC